MLFIGYSSKNNELAGEIKDELEAAHYPCFLAHDDVIAGADWHNEIWDALTRCKAFVGLVTDEFNASTFCQQEVGAAFALNKPRVLIRLGVPDPPGFAGRFQAMKRDNLISALDTQPMFRALRVEAWIQAAKTVQSYRDANAVHERFSGEWDEMSDDEKLRWLLAAASNGQVRSESYTAGPFYKKARTDLAPILTDQWLFENDLDGVLHDRESNPVAVLNVAKKKKKSES